MPPASFGMTCLNPGKPGSMGCVMAKLTTQGLKLQRTTMVSNDYQQTSDMHKCSILSEPRTQTHILTSKTDVAPQILADQGT